MMPRTDQTFVWTTSCQREAGHINSRRLEFRVSCFGGMRVNMLICSMYAIFTYIQPRSIFKHSMDMDRSNSSYRILNRSWHLFQIDEHCSGGSVYWLTVKQSKNTYCWWPRLCRISSINSMLHVANVNWNYLNGPLSRFIFHTGMVGDI